MTLDLYSDHLLVSAGGQVTATGLSRLLGGPISHDAVTRFLVANGKPLTAKELWLLVKRMIRRIESEKGVLIVDDTHCEKPYSQESPLVCWHYDHSKGRNIKGINLLTLLYVAEVDSE